MLRGACAFVGAMTGRAEAHIKIPLVGVEPRAEAHQRRAEQSGNQRDNHRAHDLSRHETQPHTLLIGSAGTVLHTIGESTSGWPAPGYRSRTRDGPWPAVYAPVWRRT